MSKKFTELFPEDLAYNKKSRIQKAKKIYAVIKDHLGDTKQLSCLDVGCSVGIITSFMGEHFKKVVGLDVDDKALKIANSLNKNKNVFFKLSKENVIPYKNESFDVMIFNQIYEHVENPKKLVSEIKRVLKKGGVCFMGARNKYGIFDGHYPPPFLSWVPRKVADVYIRATTNKDKYDINLYSFNQLKRLASGFKRTDYTLKVINNPNKYSARDAVPTKYGVNKLIFLMSKILYRFIPNYIWILEKK